MTSSNNIYARARAGEYLSLIPIAMSSLFRLFLGLGYSTGLIFSVTLSLCVLHSSTAAADLTSRLSSENEFERAKAVVALGRAKDSTAISDLTSRYAVETSKMVKLYILQALVDIPWENKVPFLESALSDADADVRLKAAQMLEQFDLPESNPALTIALNDADLRVRAAAAVALGGEAAKQTLLNLTTVSDLKLLSQALLGLSSIHAQGADVEATVRSALSHDDPHVKSAAQWAADVLGFEAAP